MTQKLFLSLQCEIIIRIKTERAIVHGNLGLSHAFAS